MAKDTKVIDTNTLLYYHQAIKTLLGDKVDKVTGKSLISDAEITRLSTVVNYNDAAVQSAITTMQGQITALENKTYDDTQLKKDIAATYATIANLAIVSGNLESHTGNTTVHITNAERTSWNDKVDLGDLASVATSGNYSDLNGKPTIPSTPSEVGADAAGSAAGALTTAKSYTDNAVNALETTINGKLTSAMHYKGSKDSFSLLPTNAEIGDVWNIVQAGIDSEGKAFSAGANVAWNGTNWDVLPGTVDLTNYYNTDDLASNSDIDTILNS